MTVQIRRKADPFDGAAQAGPPIPSPIPIARRAAVEAVGTFWLVLGGCGSAVLATQGAGIGLVGVAFAFGLTVFTMAAALGSISGCHLNPAVTAGFWASGRFRAGDVPAYVAAQLVGALLGAATVLAIAHGMPGFDLSINGLAVNGYGAGSPAGFSLTSALISETVLTAGFVLVILAVTDKGGSPLLAPLAIGLALTLVHLISIPVTNTSVNPARSTGPALLVGGLALQQLWLFWLAPIAGALIAGGLYRGLVGSAAPAIPGESSDAS
jgi:aquaporin Z